MKSVKQPGLGLRLEGFQNEISKTAWSWSGLKVFKMKSVKQPGLGLRFEGFQNEISKTAWSWSKV